VTNSAAAAAGGCELDHVLMLFHVTELCSADQPCVTEVTALWASLFLPNVLPAAEPLHVNRFTNRSQMWLSPSRRY